MYALDTNVLYYLTGLSTYPSAVNSSRLVKLIDGGECCVTSTSFFEFICNKKNGVKELRDLIELFIKHDIKVANVALEPLPEWFEWDIDSIDDGMLDDLRTFAVNNKIELESKYACAQLTVCVLLGLYFYLDWQLKGDWSVAGIACFMRKCTSLNESLVKNVFVEGYASNDCERCVKRNLESILGEELATGIAVMEAVEQHDGEQDFNIVKWVESTEFNLSFCRAKGLIAHSQSAYDFLRKLASHYKTNHGEDAYRSFLDGVYDIFIGKAQTAELGDCLRRTMKRIVEDGGKYRKNDLLDALILSVIDQVDAVITFDSGFRKIIEGMANENDKYARSVSLIASLEGDSSS